MPATALETLFVGGGTGGGKTTLARALAARHGLRAFYLDSFWYEYSRRAGEADPPPDVQWLEWTPRTQADDFERISRRNLLYALDDLRGLPKQPRVLVEGPQVVPDLLPEGANAVFLTPSAEFQRATLSLRPMPSSDPARALAARLVKDRLYADRVAALARERGFPVVEVDGSRSPEEIRAEVEERFAGFLAGNDPRELGAARRWENENAARNIRSWIASGDLLAAASLGFPFACECGRIGCAERVRLLLAEYDAGAGVLAPGH
ncbi:MAG TPA: hypothetical protein VHD91_11985 [Gaiellaceae bacterium]|nr:hypothetical protein [Gaiellaceae bacterium]